MDWSFRLVTFALALIYNLLEQERARREYGDNRPNLERRLGLRGRDVRWRFVGARRLTWLAEAGGVRSGGAKGTGSKDWRLAEQEAWTEERR